MKISYFKIGRGGVIRTLDILLPKRAVLIFSIEISMNSTTLCAPFTAKSAHISSDPLTNPLTTFSAFIDENLSHDQEIKIS